VSVYRIESEYREKGTFSSGGKTPSISKSVLGKVTEFDEICIRRIVHSFFFKKHEIPTLKKVLHCVNENPDLPNFKITSFNRLLKLMNFRYTKRSRDSILTEKDEIILWRRNYFFFLIPSSETLYSHPRRRRLMRSSGLC